jgi:hypothetical protein
VVVPSGFRIKVQPHRWMTTWWWKKHYADFGIMPTWWRKLLVAAGWVAGWSA